MVSTGHFVFVLFKKVGRDAAEVNEMYACAFSLLSLCINLSLTQIMVPFTAAFTCERKPIVSPLVSDQGAGEQQHHSPTKITHVRKLAGKFLKKLCSS